MSEVSSMRTKQLIALFSFFTFVICMCGLNTSFAVNLDPSVDVESSVAISLAGGTSPSGKRTFLVENALDFGRTSFIKPETVGNGDAYLHGETLHLEAIFSLGLVMNGMDFADVNVSKLRVSDNPFNNIYYSTSTSREVEPKKVLTEPLQNLIFEARESQSAPLRLVFEIAPQQRGRIFDRIKMEALAKS